MPSRYIGKAPELEIQSKGRDVSYKGRKNSGITESYWASLNEDQKLKWKLLSRTITFLGALAVTKTGIYYIDWIITALSTAISFLLIESQRSYTRYSPGMRKRLVRIIILLGSWCAAFIGIVYFSQAAIFSLAATFSSIPPPSMDDQHGELKNVFHLVLFACAGAYGTIKIFRQLKFEELIYHLPRQQMKKLLISKEFELKGLLGFVYFELGAILMTLCYSAITATVVSGILALVNIAVS
jgi:hypothetical protein